MTDCQPSASAHTKNDDILHRHVVKNPATSNNDTINSFSVVSYNILAECHRIPHDYVGFTDEKFLCQEYRHQLLLKELLYLDGDVVCLQEVNPKYYNDVLKPALSSHGYESTFIKRANEKFDEGEATFFKTSRFTLETFNGSVLSDLAQNDLERLSITDDERCTIKTYLNRPDVVNICRLRCCKTDRILTVGNTHISFDHLKSRDVQSIQIAYAVEAVVKLANGALILCGDFNSYPDAAGYQLARDGHLSDSNVAFLQDIKNLCIDGGQRALIDYMSSSYQKKLTKLKSAYTVCQGEEPSLTSLLEMVGIKGCLDYLFYEDEHLEALSVLQVLDARVVEATSGIPSADIPSDHLSVKASFQFK